MLKFNIIHNAQCVDAGVGCKNSIGDL